MPNYYYPSSEQELNDHNDQQRSVMNNEESLNYKYDDGTPVEVGDTAHCYDTERFDLAEMITDQITGLVEEIDGKLCVNGNDLVLTCAMHVDKIAV
jgi:hypothetical protein